MIDVPNDYDFKNMISYLGDKFQNGILTFISNIKNISLTHGNKQISIILDSSPDLSHSEQISAVV